MPGAAGDTSVDDARYQFGANLFRLAPLPQQALPYLSGMETVCSKN